MLKRRVLRLILDPALDLAMADSAAAFNLRIGLCVAFSPLLFLVLDWRFAGAWAALVFALEYEAQVFIKQRSSCPRERRNVRLGFLARATVLPFIWQLVSLALILSSDIRYFATGLILCAGTLIFAAAFSFRSPIYSAVTFAPPVVSLLVGAGVSISRQGWLIGAVFTSGELLAIVFAASAAKINHDRERRLRRTQAALSQEAQAVKRLAFDDQLTGLANRRRLMVHLDHAIARSDRGGEALALLLIDLDKFKFINDTYGHATGDALLKEVAVRLQRACREVDICARLGGDEFVVLAPGCGAVDAAALARRILQTLAEPVQLPDVTVHTGGSIGICVHAGEGADRDLLRQADLALYRVKENGRNGFCFFETEMDQAVRVRRGLESDLRRALEAEDIHVAYQPQFDGDRMVAVEALARWTHPVRGEVPPNFFIPLAEECGLIEQLGRQVIRRAFRDAAGWPHICLSINLSPVQLRVPGLVPELELLLAQSGVAASRVEFELTESILLTDDPQTQDTLAALRRLGFKLALDDFGTGYSSLSYLRKFPIDRIKIDRSFVSSLPDDKVSEAVVRAVVRLGRTLGLSVVAEGVETEEQRQALSAAGCRGVQGFLTGKPVSPERICALAAI